MFLILFLSGRRSSRPPTKLNLKAGGNSIPETQVPPATPAPMLASKGPAALPLYNPSAPHTPSRPVVEVMEPLVENKPGKNLNCFFMYNGHDWDAYQVLGVEAGSPLPVITQAYQDLIKKSDPNSFEFFEAAYKAILKSTQGYRL